jgi:peptide/nickel transport system substrate-binding protein
MSRFKALGVLLVAGLVLAACGSSTTTAPPATNASGIGGSVTLSNENGNLWTCQFNPFNGSDTGETVGFVYESLMFVNTLQNDQTTPWLATAYAWSDGNRTLTFTIRSGVKWTDGTPFSAKDVLFTFNLLKKNPALDVNSVWSVLNSVTMQGSDQIVLDFTSPATTYFYYVADQLPIVPQHIWSSIAKPVSFTDPHPVGTGPYEVKQCSGSNIQYQRNPDYWQAGLPKIETVNYPSFITNTSANEDLAYGKAQWGGQYIQDIQGYYLSKNPTDYHDWFPPLTNVVLFPNLTDKLLTLPVREAMSLAIDRSRVSELGESGYEPAANQDGIVEPTFTSWNDAAVSSEYNFNPSKAESVLESAGYKKVGGVFESPSGQKLSFSVINIGDYSDWVADLTIVTDELAQVGIQLKVENLSSTTYDSDVFNGDFQLAYDAETGGPSPYYELRQWLYGPNSAAIGQTASTNWERFDTGTAGQTSTTVDNLIKQYPAATAAGQHSIVDQLENVMVTDVPVIPVIESVDWYEYDTANLSGWPTSTDPYAQPSPYVTPDLEVVLLHLRWTK